jgi:chemotaxis family two-component system sensor kinase Cph1
LAKRYEKKLDAKAEEFIGFAIEGVKGMRALIKDLLEYSRVGTRDINLRPADFSEAVDRAVFNLKEAVEESGAVITHDPLPTIRADIVQMSRLFQNLIGNAIKFRGKKTPDIHISAEMNENGWTFSVRDNGIGIDPENADRIFAVFQRLHTKEEYPGTGIGLAICKRIVERHGGKIWVKSKEGKGSTFCFTIPDTR